MAGFMEAENWTGADMTEMLERVSEAQGAIAQRLRGSKSEALARHHLMPQVERFAEFFEKASVNNHAITARLDPVVHHALHGDKGGPWNAIWDEFGRKHNVENRPFFVIGFAVGLMYRIGQQAAEIVPW